MGFPDDSVVKNAYQYRRWGFNAQLRKIPREGNDTLLQYSCLGNPIDKRTWWAIVCGVADLT